MVYSAESMAQVELGRQGEHLARTVQIDVSCLQRAFPEAAFAPFEDYYGDVYEMGGWLNFACPGNIREVHGIGAGGWPEGTSGSYGGSGALVLRIKMD